MVKGAEGGMNSDWISKIFRSKEVQDPLDDVATRYKARLEGIAKAKYGNENSYGFHYGRANIGAGWSRVSIIFPITRSAKAHPELMDQPDDTIPKKGK